MKDVERRNISSIVDHTIRVVVHKQSVWLIIPTVEAPTWALKDKIKYFFIDNVDIVNKSHLTQIKIFSAYQ